MRPGRIAFALLALLVAATFVRLGAWQLSRAREKGSARAALKWIRERSPVVLGDLLPATAPVFGRRALLTGRWERERHILLSGRTHLGAAGVAVVTLVVLRSGERVLVERGWLAAADARTAHPEEWPDSTVEVVGFVQPLDPSSRAVPWSRLDATRPGVELWSARTLDSADVARHVPAPVAPWVVWALEVPDADRALGLVPLDEPEGAPDPRVHLSYAIQWFSFALIVIAGSIALLARDVSRESPRTTR